MKKAILILIVLAGVAWAVPPRTGQVSVPVTAPVEIGEKANRLSLTICNTDATNNIFCGASGVSTSNGLPIFAKACFTLDTGATSAIFTSPAASESVYCIATGGAVTAGYWESVR